MYEKIDLREHSAEDAQYGVRRRRQREGSIIYDALAPAAYFLADQFFQLDNVASASMWIPFSSGIVVILGTALDA